MVELNLINSEVARYMRKTVKGQVTEGRLLLAIPREYKQNSSGLYIPSTVKEDMPRKGVVIQKYNSIDLDFVNVGDIVTYGLYAGKEIEIEFQENTSLQTPENWEEIVTSNKYVVLSYNEIIFIEPNC